MYYMDVYKVYKCIYMHVSNKFSINWNQRTNTMLKENIFRKLERIKATR